MNVLEFLKNILISYLILTFVLTIFSIVKMYVVRHRVGVSGYGLDRISSLQESGRYKCIQLYSAEEQKITPKKSIVKLNFFPSDNKKSDSPVIICPGGGYGHLVTRVEGYPIAAKFNEMGYNAFVLEYRTGYYCSPYAPMEDMATALRHISDNSKEYGVNLKDYFLCGFSAGGNLCGVFGSKTYGYKHYGLPKPSGLILCYPWTNINHWIEHPYWNIWIGLLGIYLSERGNIHMFGLMGHFNKKRRDSICVQNNIDKDFPPTYMFACSGDVLVPCGAHTDVLEHAFEKMNIKAKYEKFFRLPHGIGLGVNTKASVWPIHAMEFLDNYDN